MRFQNKVRFFDEGSYKYTAFRELVKDLNFECILNYMASGKKEEIPFISDIVSCPVLDIEELKKRHSLICYLCDNPDIMEALYSLMTEFCDRYARAFKLVENGKKEIEKCSSTVSSCFELLQTLSQFVTLFQRLIEKYNLSDKEPFNLLLNSFFENIDSPFCGEFASNIDSYKKGGELVLLVEAGHGFKFSGISFEEVRNRKKKRGFLHHREESSVLYKEESVCAGGMEMADFFVVNLLKQNWGFFREWKLSFECMRRQSAFLNGCVKLYLRGMERDFYFSYPCLEGASCEMTDLYELSMAFQMSAFPVTNDLMLTGKKVLVVTGANQGGKSTFLRSLGIAQLMYQCGMYVPARRYSSKMYRQIFSHFTRREDSAMNTGRFEEELKRMHFILHNAEAGSLILSNETFCGTTEVIAAQAAMAIVEGTKNFDIDLWMVTHISQFAMDLYNQKKDCHLFLSAAHRNGGQEPFKMIKQKPENTSFGMELYREVLMLEEG